MRSAGRYTITPRRLEAEGHRILQAEYRQTRAPFGFDAPDVIMRDMIQALALRAGLFGFQGDPAGAACGSHPL